jgi:hypothetical protein
MADLKLRQLASLKIGGTFFISAALAVAASAQAPRQLRVEVGPNQQVRIFASSMSYGEALRTLQRELGWEIEIPPLADELTLSYVRVEATQPQDALAKLLEGSGLGYAYLGGVNGSHRILKVVVIPSTQREARVIQRDTASSLPTRNDTVVGASWPPAQGQALTTIQPNATAVETMRPEAPLKMPLSEAAKAIGGPPGSTPAAVGRMTRFAISDAARIMGVPPGMSLGDVGKSTTLPLPDAARIMGVPPGMSLGDVGKTTTFPLPTGLGKHP